MEILKSIFLVLITTSLYAQNSYDEAKVSSQTSKTIKKIEQVNILMGSGIGIDGARPKQWDNFEELRKATNKEELIELTNHSNGVVRCYSLWALSYYKDIDLFEIVNRHLTDYELVETHFGCIKGREMVGDFFVQKMIAENVDTDSEDIRKLDSLLIYHSNKLSSRYRAISRAEPTEHLYPIIRELVVDEKNPSALITLAKYRKEQDVEIIKNFREETDRQEGGYYHTYAAMQEFPRQEYLPILERNLRKTLDNTHFSMEWKGLYAAIASFKDEKALALLEIPFSEVQHERIKKYHIDFVFDAVMEFQSPIYDELLWRMWEEENQRTLKSYKYLLSLNPAKAYELTKRELIEGYQPQKTEFVPVLDEIEDSDSFYEYLLNVLIANDEELSNKVIQMQIEKASVHNLPLFTSKVNKQRMFIESLFKRLEDAWNAHIYLNLIETLIEFEDSEINQRILEVRKRNHNLNENWGGEALDKLLAKHGIK